MRCKLIVSEPWDFAIGENGTNDVFGDIDISVRHIGKYGEWLIMRCEPFEFEDIIINSLLVLSRYNIKERLDVSIQKGESVNVNAHWLKSGQEWTVELVEQAEKDPTIIGGWFIGPLQVEHSRC